MNPRLGDKLILSSTDNAVSNYKEQFDENTTDLIQNAVTWKFYENDNEILFKDGHRLELIHKYVCPSLKLSVGHKTTLKTFFIFRM